MFYLLYWIPLHVLVLSLECLITKLHPLGRDYFGKLDFKNGSQWRYWPASELPSNPTVCDDTWEICKTAIPPETTTAPSIPCTDQYEDDGTGNNLFFCKCVPNNVVPGLAPNALGTRDCYDQTLTHCDEMEFDDMNRNGTRICRCLKTVFTEGTMKQVIIRNCRFGQTIITTTPPPVTRIPGKCIACGKTAVKKDNGDEFVALGCYGSAYIISRGMELDDCTYHPNDETAPNREREKGTKSVCFCNKDGCNEGSQLVHVTATLITSLILSNFII